MKRKSNKDYWNYDYIDLSVKTDRVEEVVLAYNNLGWQEIERYADKQYKDVLHLSFKREHKLADKDELQYLQVSYERLINKRNTREFKMHDKSSIVLTCICVLLTMFFVLAFLALSKHDGLIYRILLIVLIFASIIAVALALKLNKKMRNNEKEKQENYAREINGQIAEVFAKVNEIRGKQNEQTR